MWGKGQGSYTYTYIYKSNILRTIALLKLIFTYDLVCRKCLWSRTDIFSEIQDDIWAFLWTEEHHEENVHQDAASVTVYPAEEILLRLGGKLGVQVWWFLQGMFNHRNVSEQVINAVYVNDSGAIPKYKKP